MTGAVFTQAEGFIAPAARGFTCRFRPADGILSLLRQRKYPKKGEPGQPALRATLRCSLFRGRGTTRPCEPQTRPAPDPGKPALLGGFQGDSVLTDVCMSQSLPSHDWWLARQCPRSRREAELQPGFRRDECLSPVGASCGTPLDATSIAGDPPQAGDGAGAPWGCRGAWQDKPPDVPPGTPGMQTPRRRRCKPDT